MKAVALAVLGVLVGTAMLAGGATAGHKPNGKHKKVSICHREGNGSYHLIRVSRNAVKAHKRHGDAKPEHGVDGGLLDEECNFVEPTRYSSSPLSFGPMGWAGWSCPSGMTAVGGGTTLSDVTAEGVAEPGATIGGFTYPTFPHYTFPAGETGYVVQNDNDGETGEVFVDCLPST